MNSIKFRCKCCNDYHEMKKKIPNGFSAWSYSDMEWSDFEKEVPPLSEEHWTRSDRIPKVGEFRIVKVKIPFYEKIRNEFYMEFMPASAFFNGYDNADQIRDSAIVQCKFEKIILADEYSAWIKIKVLKVILLSELLEIYPPCLADCELEEYAGVSRCVDIDFMDASWEVTSWTAQGDTGESKIIYMGEDGIRHLVLMHYYDYFSNITYFGNSVQTK